MKRDGGHVLALLLALVSAGSCAARLTLAGGMPGVTVPINDAPARRVYDSGSAMGGATEE